ncbi:APC family permease [Mycoplasma sp. 394]
MKKHFSEKSFTFFTINFIVGLGFLTTFSEILNIGFYGYLVIALCLLTMTGTALVFARLGNAFKEHYGGSYAYARHLDSTLFEEQSNVENKWYKFKKGFVKNFCYFIGWNQFLQSPVLSSVSPLFLAQTFELVIPKTISNYITIIWIIRVIAFIFFGALILISTKGLSLNTKVVFLTSAVKWAFLLIGFVNLVYLSVIKPGGYTVVYETTKKATSTMIFGSILVFIFAFAGIEDMASMAKDAEFKNFKRILFVSLGIVAVVYLAFYSVYLAIKFDSNNNEFSQIYYLVMNITGTIVFIIGFIFNDIGYKITQTVSTARKLIPLALDNHINPKYADHNKHGEYRNAIILTAVITFIAMLVLWLVPTLLSKTKDNDNPFFTAVIKVNSLALLIEDTLTAVVALILEKKKQISKIPWWEKTIYIVNILWISTLILFFLVPNILGNNWDETNTFVVVVYLSFVLIGFIIKWMWIYKQKKPNNLKKIIFWKEIWNKRKKNNV